MGIEFVGMEPPPRGKSGSQSIRKGTLETLAALRKRQGEWALVRTAEGPGRKLSGSKTTYTRWGLEAVTRRVDGVAGMYVCWPRGMRVPPELEGLV